MQKWITLFILILGLTAFKQTASLKGTWQYAGGISKGVYYEAPKGYKMHRVYDDKLFEAFSLEDGEKPLKYEAGSYTLKNDSCIEIQTFSLQGQQMVGIPIRYSHLIRNDSLILKGVLPNGAPVEDYWKKVK